MRKALLLAILASLVLCGVSAKAKKPKNVAGAPQIVDHKGQAVGVDIPKWVKDVAIGDKAGAAKELGIDKGRTLFILSRDGENIDFLKTWVDQVDARTEVASSLKTTVANVVKTEMAAQKVDNEESVTQKVETFTQAASTITLEGLQKDADYWTKTRTLKTGVKKAKSDSDYNYKVTYYVVFSIDSKLYDQQLKKAMDDIEDNDDQTEMLRNAVAQQCTGIITGVSAAD